MKKNTKFLVLLLALLMMCLCLTGCDELDYMRESQAFWTVDGNTDSITFDGVEYKRLDATNPPNPMYNSNYTDAVFVTDSDVPVLLSRDYCVSLNISEDKNFIYGYVFDDYTNEVYGVYDGDGREAVYCKADIYDEVMEKINEGIKYTNYGFGYSYWDDEKNEDVWEYYYMNDTETKALNKVFEDPKLLTYDEVDTYEYITDFNKVSDDKYFGQGGYIIYSDGRDSYYIGKYSETLEEEVYYAVPEELNDTFREIKSKVQFYY